MNYQNLMKLRNMEFLGLTEPNTNSLIMIFAHCKVSDVSEDILIRDKLIKDAHPIDVDMNSPVIQLDFESYISYSLTNESFTQWDEYEVFEGNAFRIYTKSRYLDFIKTSTFAYQVCGDLYPPLAHYGIVCLNHIINIVSTVKPIITEINRQ